MRESGGVLQWRHRRASLASPFYALALSVALIPGCVSGSERLTELERKELAAHTLDQAPDGIRPLNVNFDDQVTLLGYRVRPDAPVRPGQSLDVTLYWRADKRFAQRGWRLFTHVLDAAGERVLNIDNVGVLRRLHDGEQVLAPSDWTQGKVYADAQTFTLPEKLDTDSLRLVTGVWRENDRLAIKSGPHVSENRALVGTLAVAGQKARPARSKTLVPELAVAQLPAGLAIELDGKLQEPAWEKAGSTGPFVDPNTGEPPASAALRGKLRLLWDPQFLYLGFEVDDVDVQGGFDPAERDPHLWTRDCVEVMIDPDGDGDNKDYYEIQIGPQNLVFDSQFDEYNQPRPTPDGPFGHQEWSAQLQSAVSIQGTLESGDVDEGYVVEARIPWASFNKAQASPPRSGDSWRMNFYAMQNNGGVSWSPLLRQGNFHRASRFGKITWVRDLAPSSP